MKSPAIPGSRNLPEGRECAQVATIASAVEVRSPWRDSAIIENKIPEFASLSLSVRTARICTMGAPLSQADAAPKRQIRLERLTPEYISITGVEVGNSTRGLMAAPIRALPLDSVARHRGEGKK